MCTQTIVVSYLDFVRDVIIKILCWENVNYAVCDQHSFLFNGCSQEKLISWVSSDFLYKVKCYRKLLLKLDAIKSQIYCWQMQNGLSQQTHFFIFTAAACSQITEFLGSFKFNGSLLLRILKYLLTVSLKLCG